MRGSRAEQPLAVALALGNIGFGLAGTATELVPFDVKGSLPLQICDFAWVAVAWALLTRHRVALALTYYWGLTLSLQAMAQPTLDDAFPDPNFFAFWGKHVLLVWGAVYATLSLRQGPDWRGYRQAVAATFVWVAGVMCLNPLLGSNYGYFNAKARRHRAGLPRPVALVRPRRGGDRARRLGADHAPLDRAPAPFARGDVRSEARSRQVGVTGAQRPPSDR